MERIFKVMELPSGERIEGVELSAEHHPGHDPLAAGQPSAFVRYVGADGVVARMERHVDELRAVEWIDSIARRIGG